MLEMCSFVSNELLNALICDNMADVDRLFEADVSVVCGVDCDVKCKQLEVFWWCGMVAATIEALVVLVIGTKLFTEYLRIVKLKMKNNNK